MAEIGRVTKLDGDFVTVKLQRQDACGHCNACTAGVETDDMILEAQNLCLAEEGDLVEISIEESNFLLAVIIMYIIPLGGLLVGVFLGYLLGKAIGVNEEITSLIVGFLLLAATYITIRLNEKRFNTTKFRPIAHTVVKDHE